MALIKNFVPKNIERYSIHDGIDAQYAAFERDGRFLLQIDTYGRNTREIPGKVSQSIQLDRNSAMALYEIIKNTFHFS